VPFLPAKFQQSTNEAQLHCLRPSSYLQAGEAKSQQVTEPGTGAPISDTEQRPLPTDQTTKAELEEEVVVRNYLSTKRILDFAPKQTSQAPTRNEYAEGI
jgi:hypothetical protein